MNAPFSLTEPSATNTHEFSVSELSRSVKRSIEDQFGQVRVRGEIGGFRGRHSSGHCYFSLKDSEATLDAVVWRSAYGKLSIPPEEGLEVVATGRLTTFARNSSYQLVVDQLEPAGVGALMKLLEERRKKLAAEGLFDEERKRPLPTHPRVIGVVTSPTGAVIRDILHRVSERFPSHVVVWPVRVQGETSGTEVANAVAGFSGAYGGPRPDVIIVARGGGSVEDLWGYNDEAVVRAVAASPIPVVSAVGHETDWTLIDHAADKRAPTPTGAAEMVVPVRADRLATLADRARRLDTAMATFSESRRAALRLLARGLPPLDALLQMPRQRLDLASDKLTSALFRTVSLARQRYAGTAGRLSPSLAARPLAQARDQTDALSARLDRAMDASLREASRQAERLDGRLGPHLLARPIGEARSRLSTASDRADRAMARLNADRRQRWQTASKLLAAVSYTAVLDRGFALVRRADDSPIRRAGEIGSGDALQLQFADARVSVVEAGGAPRPVTQPAKAVAPNKLSRRAGKKNPNQTELF
ncbi:MAG: exodeoxyribonuclease VII large subunit [Pseudomonadota bacterium]